MLLAMTSSRLQTARRRRRVEASVACAQRAREPRKHRYDSARIEPPSSVDHPTTESADDHRISRRPARDSAVTRRAHLQTRASCAHCRLSGWGPTKDPFGRRLMQLRPNSAGVNFCCCHLAAMRRTYTRVQESHHGSPARDQTSWQSSAARVCSVLSSYLMFISAHAAARPTVFWTCLLYTSPSPRD